MPAFFHSFPVSGTWMIPSLAVSYYAWIRCRTYVICAWYVIFVVSMETYLLGATLGSQLLVSLLFTWTYCLHLQDRKVNQACNKQTLFLLLDFCLPGLLLDPEDGETTRRHIPEHGTRHSRNCFIWNGTEKCRQNIVLKYFVLRKKYFMLTYIFKKGLLLPYVDKSYENMDHLKLLKTWP
jgi:hypothetical protein